MAQSNPGIWETIPLGLGDAGREDKAGRTLVWGWLWKQGWGVALRAYIMRHGIEVTGGMRVLLCWGFGTQSRWDWGRRGRLPRGLTCWDFGNEVTGRMPVPLCLLWGCGAEDGGRVEAALFFVV